MHLVTFRFSFLVITVFRCKWILISVYIVSLNLRYHWHRWLAQGLLLRHFVNFISIISILSQFNRCCPFARLINNFIVIVFIDSRQWFITFLRWWLSTCIIINIVLLLSNVSSSGRRYVLLQICVWFILSKLITWFLSLTRLFYFWILLI